MSRLWPAALRSAAPDRSALFWILELGGWGLFGAGMLVAGLSIWPAAYAVVNKSSLTLFGFAASLLLRVAYRTLNRVGAPLAVLLAAAVPLSFGAAGLWMAAHHALLSAYAADRGARSGGGFPDFTNTIYFFFVLVAWSVLYFAVPSYLELAAQRQRLARAEELAHRARLHALRLQLNPHFLFNTLNAISTLVSESRALEANRMLSRLSDFLRATLDRTEKDEIPLADEIDFACQYLEIEETRFGDRLRIDVTVAPGTESALVPPMILQPLVENAVRHAIGLRESGGGISIVASREDDWLTLGVHDDGPGLSGEIGAGVGLSNTRQRLAELYGTSAELTLARSERGGLSASIRLPFRAPVRGTA
jgi:two-component system, LytTR family, sensor kinase